MIYSNDTYDITSNISTYLRRDFKSVYDTTAQKWYMLNNLGEYEEYGIYGTSLSDTYYVGKLVETGGHEYEWDGTEWDDLGTSLSIPYIQFPTANTLGASAYYDTGLRISNTYSLEFKIKTPNSNNKWRQVLTAQNTQTTINGYSYGLYVNQNGANFGMIWWKYASGERSYNDTAFAYTPNTEYVFEIQVGTGVTKINGVTQSGTKGTNNNGTTTGNLLICSGYNGDPGFNGRVYYVKVYDSNSNLIGYFQADNNNGNPGFKNMLNETMLTKGGSGSISYGDDGGGRPKEYPTKAAPTITNVYASRLFRNGNHYVKMMRNDALLEFNYMSESLSKKVDFITEPYNTKAYIQLPNTTSYSASAYYDTGIYLKNTYTIEIKIKTPDGNGSRGRQIIGAYESGLGSNEFALDTQSNNNYFGMNWWNYGQRRLNNDTAFAYTPNTEYVFEIQVGTGVTKINGVTQSTSGGNNVSGTLNKTLKFGAADYTLEPGFNGRIYYVKVTEENTLIGYFQANYNDGSPGFKNMLNGNMLTKGGTGSVTYGEDA